MSASDAILPEATPRDRSIEARRAARVAKAGRERLILDCLNRGVSIAEIAARIGVTEKRLRALVREILARHAPAAPDEAFAALQASRLTEALLVAYSAMSPENLKAVALVVRIVRELDRYHGFATPARPPRREASAADAAASAARLVTIPRKAPQAVENTETAPDNATIADACGSAPLEARNAGPARGDAARAEPTNGTGPAPVAPQSGPTRAAPRAGADSAPQAFENIESAPGTTGVSPPAPRALETRPRRRATRRRHP